MGKSNYATKLLYLLSPNCLSLYKVKVNRTKVFNVSLVGNKYCKQSDQRSLLHANMLNGSLSEESIQLWSTHSLSCTMFLSRPWWAWWPSVVSGCCCCSSEWTYSRQLETRSRQDQETLHLTLIFIDTIVLYWSWTDQQVTGRHTYETFIVHNLKRYLCKNAGCVWNPNKSSFKCCLSNMFLYIEKAVTIYSSSIICRSTKIDNA